MTPAETIALIGVSGSIVLGISSTALTAYKMYLDNRERTSHYREALYEKQVEGYVEIFLALREWHNYVQGYLMHIDSITLKTDEHKIDLRKSSVKLSIAFQGVVHARRL